MRKLPFARKLIAILCFLVGVVVCADSGLAFFHRGVSAYATSCPQGTGFPTDGCTGEPAPLTASLQHSNSFQSGGYVQHHSRYDGELYSDRTAARR